MRVCVCVCVHACVCAWGKCVPSITLSIGPRGGRPPPATPPPQAHLHPHAHSCRSIEAPLRYLLAAWSDSRPILVSWAGREARGPQGGHFTSEVRLSALVHAAGRVAAPWGPGQTMERGRVRARVLGLCVCFCRVPARVSECIKGVGVLTAAPPGAAALNRVLHGTMGLTA